MRDATLTGLTGMISRIVRMAAGVAWATRAESLLVLAILGTWSGATLAVYRIVTAYLPAIRDAVLPAAIAVLCASAAGWKFLLALARDGLYVLTRGGDDA